VPGDNSKADDWTAEDKLAVVIETAGLNSAQLREYCRSKGLYPEQIDQWKTAALSGYQRHAQTEKEKNRYRQEDRRQIKRLESELRPRKRHWQKQPHATILAPYWLGRSSANSQENPCQQTQCAGKKAYSRRL
jgi:hypothetical protein